MSSEYPVFRPEHPWAEWIREHRGLTMFISAAIVSILAGIVAAIERSWRQARGDSTGVYKQGSVIIRAVKTIPDEARKRPDLVLPVSEDTLDTHRIETSGIAELLEDSGNLYLRVVAEPANWCCSGVTISLPVGVYRVSEKGMETRATQAVSIEGTQAADAQLKEQERKKRARFWVVLLVTAVCLGMAIGQCALVL